MKLACKVTGWLLLVIAFLLGSYLAIKMARLDALPNGPDYAVQREALNQVLQSASLTLLGLTLSGVALLLVSRVFKRSN